MYQILESHELMNHGIQEETTIVWDSIDLPTSNPLLYLFVQYAWNEEHGPCLDGHEYKIIEKWLVSFREGIQFTDNTSSDEKDEYSKYENIINHLVNVLKDVLSWLVDSKGDVHYNDYRKDTILHIVFKNHLEIFNDTSEDQIIKIRKLIKALVEMKAPLFEKNSDEVIPFYLATKSKNRHILPAIVDNLIDVDACDEDGNTALHIIVDNCLHEDETDHKEDYLDLVRTLIFKGVKVNAKNKKGVTPVHLAAEKFHVEMLKLFADNRANFQERTKFGETPLHLACKSSIKLRGSSKTTKTFEFLVSQGCSIRILGQDSYTMLHYAAESGPSEIVKKLIDYDFDVDCRTKKTLLTPLYLAAKSDQLEKMKLLVEAGADVNAEAVDGSTPIFMSAMMGSYESLQFLINQGANLYRRDNLRGFTLLHMVANNLGLKAKKEEKKNKRLKIHNLGLKTKKEDEEEKNDGFMIFKVLIEKNYDVNDTGYCGVTPLQLVTLVPNTEAAKILIDRGANVNYQNKKLEWTALHLAVIMGDREITNILLANGADVNCRGYHQRTPLHLSLLKNKDLALGIYSNSVDSDDPRLLCPIVKCWSYSKYKKSGCSGRMDLMEILIKNGANVNVEDTFGKTPLHMASKIVIRDCYWNCIVVMRKLLEMGARPDVQDKNGNLPLHHIFEKGNGRAMELLIDYGADFNDDDTTELLMNCDMNNIRTEELPMENCKTTCTSLVIREAIKRKLIGLPVAKIYEQLVNDPRFANCYNRCLAEATQLMNHRHANGFSIYEFLRMKPKHQYLFVQKILGSYEKIKEQFPNYANLIRGACRYSVERKPLFESARISWNQIFDNYLPDLCIDHILDNLNNRYLKVLATTGEEVAVVEENKIAFQIDIDSKIFIITGNKFLYIKRML